MLAEGLKLRIIIPCLPWFSRDFYFFALVQGLKGGCSPRFKADSQSMLVSHGLACPARDDAAVAKQMAVPRAGATRLLRSLVSRAIRALTLAADLSLNARSGVKSSRTSDVASVEWTSECRAAAPALLALPLGSGHARSRSVRP